MMVVRIMEDEQYRLSARYKKRFDKLDQQLLDAVQARDQAAFTTTLGELHAFIHKYGQPVPHSEVIPSDLQVPAADLTLAEAIALLHADVKS